MLGRGIYEEYPDKYKNLIEDKIESPIKKINYLKNANNKPNDLKIKYVCNTHTISKK